jgi:hypothetical protein
MFGSYMTMIALSFATVPWGGVVGFLWTWLAVELFQIAFIVRLNVKLFAHIETIEFVYLRRLISICVPALIAALLLLHRIAALAMPLQVVIAVASGMVIAAVGWQLFHVRQVLDKIGGQFARRFEQPV